MPSHSDGDAPIYESLIGEQGDVPAEARQAAEEAQRTTNQALDHYAPAQRPSPPREPEPLSRHQQPFPGPEQSRASDMHGRLPPPRPQQPQEQPSSSPYEPSTAWTSSPHPAPDEQPPAPSFFGGQAPGGRPPHRED